MKINTTVTQSDKSFIEKEINFYEIQLKEIKHIRIDSNSI